MPRQQLPADHRWGEQTQKAIENFPVSGDRIPPEMIDALAMIKAESAAVNAQIGQLPQRLADAIRKAADEILRGEMADQFPVDVFQTGSGTSTNMNMNEVIANRASEIAGEAIHPNDHVNAAQSSNDTFPSAGRIAAVMQITLMLLPALDSLRASLVELSARHVDTVKMARTHLMDAVPITFGQEVSGWARSVELGANRLRDVLPRLAELPLGGTAVGTGLNAPEGFGAAVADRLSARTGCTFKEAANHFEAQSSQDPMVEAGAMLKVVALSLHKIAGDLRLLGSGPNGGLGELQLPALQAGSSIMPGKVNPVIPEMVQQVAAQVVGNDATITFAATLSTLQLSTAMPITARSVLSSIHLLTSAATLLDSRCIRSVEVDKDRMRRNAERSPAIVTALAPRIGYDAAARLVYQAQEQGESLQSLIEAQDGDSSAGSADVLLAMTRPSARTSR
ncbi:MAG TPA: class II fumarate hydratase [Ilumatobacteraceae bacterium]|nr:class II fumarate hydratase [Ilumatobacteraceae bacterium]